MSTSREHPRPDKFVRYRRGMWTKLDEIKAELAELRGDLRAVYHHRGGIAKVEQVSTGNRHRAITNWC